MVVKYRKHSPNKLSGGQKQRVAIESEGLQPVMSDYIYV